MDAMPEVLRRMIGWGFTKVDPQPDSAFMVMRGSLPTSQGHIPCEVWIDKSFTQSLQVYLTQLPDSLPRILPHVGSDGFLCYSAPGTEVIDIFDPVQQTGTSLRQAVHVLEQVVSGKMVEDLQEEFFAYWSGIFCLGDIERRSSGRLELLQLSDNKLYVLTDSAERSQKKFARLGRQISKLDVRIEMITSSAAPRPLQKEWPPKTVAQILDWQGELDNACRRKIREKIVSAYRDGKKSLLIIIESNKTGFSYGFFIRDLQQNRPEGCRAIDQRLPIYECQIRPVQMLRFDEKYLAERNIPGQATFVGKRIGLIGCGTIGGFLAEMLVKAGAGSGGGELRLIDNDLLMPQNIGRHRLGFNRLLEEKAEGLAKELVCSTPFANVVPRTVDAKQANLDELDLIIDATGEEALGHWLAKAVSTPILHVWIEGAGVAVRSLLKQHPSQGCYRCLSDMNREGDLLSVVNGVSPIFAGQGCEGLYVPFSASVSIQAAALALDGALAWVGRKSWPALSTRLTNQSFELATSDCSPVRRQGCPACGL